MLNFPYKLLAFILIANMVQYSMYGDALITEETGFDPDAVKFEFYDNNIPVIGGVIATLGGMITWLAGLSTVLVSGASALFKLSTFQLATDIPDLIRIPLGFFFGFATLYVFVAFVVTLIGAVR